MVVELPAEEPNLSEKQPKKRGIIQVAFIAKVQNSIMSWLLIIC